MTPDQAYKCIKGVIDTAVQRGLFANVDSVSNVHQALQVLQPPEPRAIKQTPDGQQLQ